MPVTISGDVPRQIEALVQKLSDDKMRDLAVQLRDSLVRRLWNVQWSGKPSAYIGRGLTAHSEPVRTPTGGWMCGVGSLDILHREDAPPRTITEFLYWYQTQYMPEERAERAAEKVKIARKEAAAEAIWQRNVTLFGAYRTQATLDREMAQLRNDILVLKADIHRLEHVLPVKYDFRSPRVVAKYKALKARRSRQIKAKEKLIIKKREILAEKGKRLQEATKRIGELRQKRG